jgi:acyl carrier protein
MKPWAVGILVGATALAGVVMWLAERVTKRSVERRLAGRPHLDPSRFGARYFGETASRATLAADIRTLLEPVVPFTLQGLDPDDAFVADLRLDELDSLFAVEFLQELERHFAIAIPNEDAARLITFRQLVDYVDRRVKDKEATRHNFESAG